MASLVKDEPQVAEYFRDAVLEIVDPNCPEASHRRARRASNSSKLGPDVKGDIFEYLLTHLGQSALNGQFRTPRQIRAFMVRDGRSRPRRHRLRPGLRHRGLPHRCRRLPARASIARQPQEMPIYGEEWLEKRGQTLEEAKKQISRTCRPTARAPGERIPDWKLLEASIYGIDVSRQMMRIAMMNLVLHGIRGARTQARERRSPRWAASPRTTCNRRYKVILSNPPFAGQLPERVDPAGPADQVEEERAALPRPDDEARSLPAAGARWSCRKALLFGSTSAHVELRKKLLERVRSARGRLAACWRLQALRRRQNRCSRLPTARPTGKKRAHRQAVWFYEVKNDGFDPDKIQGGGRPGDAGEKRHSGAACRVEELQGFARFEEGARESSRVRCSNQAASCRGLWWAPVSRYSRTTTST